jgi:anthranilate phosphoribosyltransferase
LKKTKSAALRGGDAETNAAAMRGVLEGKDGAYREIAIFNAAAALVVAGRAEDLKDGVALAKKSVDSGDAIGRLDRLVAVSNA